MRKWTPEQRKQHGDKIRAAYERKRVPPPLMDRHKAWWYQQDIVRLRSTALYFWDALLGIYAGEPPATSLVTEEFCLSAMKDSARRAASLVIASNQVAENKGNKVVDRTPEQE